MAQTVTREIFVATPPERLFDVIVAYGEYPEFLSNVKSCRVVDRQGIER